MYIKCDPNIKTKTKNMKLSLETAQKVIKAAIEKSKSLQLNMNIAVVDEGSNLLAFARMDGSWLGSTDIAIKKAKTSVLFSMSTKLIGPLSQPGQPLYAIEHSNNGLITFAGGVPIYFEGKVIGAIGVSGSTVENDQTVAEYASDLTNCY